MLEKYNKCAISTGDFRKYHISEKLGNQVHKFDWNVFSA